MRGVHSGAIALMTGVACAAVAYAARENAHAVVGLAGFVAMLGGFLAAARDDR